MGSTGQFRLITTFVVGACIASAYEAPTLPFAPAAGEDGSTAIHLDDPRILGWAEHVESVSFGEDVAEEWRNPEAALGPADLSGMNVTVLGRGGQIVLRFPDPIVDGEGYDFAVFENSFSGSFLELAFVEVSTDGQHYVRFPNYSFTAGLIPGFGDLDPTLVYGFAGKYTAGHGTPFDLSELAMVSEGINGGYQSFSNEYRDAFVANYPFLDLENIQYIRIIDIPGDGSQSDCQGFPIYDPFKTLITAGFDLDALAVMNKDLGEAISFKDWSEEFSLSEGRSADPDGDGWNNYLEYSFGTNPQERSSKPEIDLSVDMDGSFKMTYWFRVRAEALPLLYTSEDGSQWQAVEPGFLEIQDLDQQSVGDFVFVLRELKFRDSNGTGLFRFQLPD